MRYINLHLHYITLHIMHRLWMSFASRVIFQVLSLLFFFYFALFIFLFIVLFIVLSFGVIKNNTKTDRQI